MAFALAYFVSAANQLIGAARNGPVTPQKTDDGYGQLFTLLIGTVPRHSLRQGMGRKDEATLLDTFKAVCGYYEKARMLSLCALGSLPSISLRTEPKELPWRLGQSSILTMNGM